MEPNSGQDWGRELIRLASEQLETSRALLQLTQGNAERQAQAIKHQEESIAIQRAATRRMFVLVAPLIAIVLVLMILFLGILIRRSL